MPAATHPARVSPTEAQLEQIRIPPKRSFLWRQHDYPWHLAVWNYHPEVEIHLIRNASGLAFVGDYIGPFEDGNLMILGSNLPHNWMTPNLQGKTILGRDMVLQFDPDLLLASVGQLPELSYLAPLLDKARRGIELLGPAAKRGREIIEGMGDHSSAQQMPRLLEFLALAAETPDQRCLASQHFIDTLDHSSDHLHRKLGHALAYIQENFLETLNIGEVAEQLGMSESVFSRFFKRRTGNTFTEHILSLRIFTAQKLLAESTVPITEICYQSGFNNISNFNRTFLRRVGMSPSHYRRSAHARDGALRARAG